MIKSEETCHYFKILILIFCFSLFTFSQPLYHAFPLGLLVGCQEIPAAMTAHRGS